MNLTQVWAVLRKEWWHIARDRRTFVLVALSPVLFLVVMAYSFAVEVRDVDLAVMDLDSSAASRSYVATLTDSGDLRECCRTDQYADVEGWLVDGKAKAAVVIPPGFADAVEGGGRPSVQVIVDGTDPNTAEHAMSHILSRTEAWGARRLASAIGLGDLPAAPIDLRVRTLYDPSLEYIIGIVPALIAVVLSLPAMAASLAITREKEWGTLEGLIATPIGRVELLLGKLLPYEVTGMLSVVLCAAVAVWWFGVPMRGSVWLYLALSAIYLLAALSLGLLISVLVPTQQAAMLVAFLVFLFPGFFLSGIFIPLAAMGELRYEALMFPTTHYVLINRGLFLKGAGLDALWPWATALVLFAVAEFAAALFFFRKHL
ncbi:MAG: ABC transporter permease [Anaerolineae bacterium]